ncbi:unnamed protein product [Linum tenue]|nr:unnamed protein product [Linum tenue]
MGSPSGDPFPQSHRRVLDSLRVELGARIAELRRADDRLGDGGRAVFQCEVLGGGIGGLRGSRAREDL